MEKGKFDKVITLPATVEQLDLLLEWISGIMEVHACSGKACNQAAVVAEEIFVNIVEYAYDKNNEKKDVVVRVSIQEDPPKTLIIQFEDYGMPFNLLDHKLPDINANIETREVGGLGIYLTRKWMDIVEYERLDGKNILTLTKRL
jgi:sigma-B regulation protein RsbU (phosphoserine phosphatase)